VRVLRDPPPYPSSDLEAARSRLREGTWTPFKSFWPRLRSFVKSYWHDITHLPVVPLIAAGLAFCGVTGLAVWNDEHRWKWIALALLVVLLIQLAVAYRRHEGKEAVRLQTIEEMIEEGLKLIQRVKTVRLIPHNVLNPADPDTGHPDVQLAWDFYSRTEVVLPAGYLYDLRITFEQVTAEYDAFNAQRVKEEEEAAKREGREPEPIRRWIPPFVVSAAIRLLSDAHKDLSRGN
jgi:hypothetical protein